MLSVVEQGGFQFAVSEGDSVRVPLIDAEKGAEVKLDKVLLVRNGDTVTVGTPEVAGAAVKAKIVEHGKYDKILIVKKHRRKDYKRRTGHRQTFTEIQITSISL